MDRACQVCLDQLTTRPRTRAELASTLLRRGFAPEVVDMALDRVGSVGLVDDAAFARAWVESRHQGRGLSRRALRHELAGKGVAPDLVDEALSEIGQDDELRAATRIAARRLARMGGLAADVRERRLLGLLARRGYSEGVARAACRAASEAADGDLR